MAPKRSPTTRRKPRTDAQRNRERILEAAKQTFTRSGASASLDEIAKQAGVGPGTLYRHFSTREALLEGVYRTELEKLADAAPKFAQSMTRVEALRAWLLLFIDAIAAKKIIASALNPLIATPSKEVQASHDRVQEAIRMLVKGAVESGDIREDLDPFDLIKTLVGFCTVTTRPDWQESARRLVDILIAGSRPVGK